MCRNGLCSPAPRTRAHRRLLLACCPPSSIFKSHARQRLSAGSASLVRGGFLVRLQGRASRGSRFDSPPSFFDPARAGHLSVVVCYRVYRAQVRRTCASPPRRRFYSGARGHQRRRRPPSPAACANRFERLVACIVSGGWCGRSVVETLASTCAGVVLDGPDPT